MPLLARLIGSLAGGLASFFALFWSYHVALKLASYTTWITVLVAFLAAVLVCINSMFAGVASAAAAIGGGEGGWVSMFWVGLGMFIPANSGAVISCYASVWIATSLYKIKKQGIHTYGA